MRVAYGPTEPVLAAAARAPRNSLHRIPICGVKFARVAVFDGSRGADQPVGYPSVCFHGVSGSPQKIGFVAFALCSSISACQASTVGRPGTSASGAMSGVSTEPGQEETGTLSGAGLTTTSPGNDAEADDGTFRFALGGGTPPGGSGGLGEGCEKVDFIFVIDNSKSMSDDQMALIESFLGFIQGIELMTGGDDYHVGVVGTGSRHANPSPCDTKAAPSPFKGLRLPYPRRNSPIELVEEARAARGQTGALLRGHRPRLNPARAKASHTLTECRAA